MRSCFSQVINPRCVLFCFYADAIHICGTRFSLLLLAVTTDDSFAFSLYDRNPCLFLTSSEK
jgi:hypothetical protein